VIYERQSDMRKSQISAGRSINLALSTRGIKALNDVRLDKKILKDSIPMRGRMMHALNGDLTFQLYGKEESEVIYSISRAQLNKVLMSEAENKLGVKIHFDEKCIGMDLDTGEIELQNKVSGEYKTISTDIVIGADGANSAIRRSMLTRKGFNFSQQFLKHGYKELTIPAGSKNKYMMENNVLHIWPRGSYMLIALPNLDGSFTCTLFLPFKGEYGFDHLKTKDTVESFFESKFPDVLPLMPTLTKDFFSNPTDYLVTVKCDPWHVRDRVLLLGDSAHAIVPFFGQGMNCAFENCTYLDEFIQNLSPNWNDIFIEYGKLRKKKYRCNR